MITTQIRLCSRTAASWFEGLAALDPHDEVSVPSGLGPTIRRAIEAEIRKYPTVEQLLDRSPKGMFLAKLGPSVSPPFVSSVAHVAGMVAAIHRNSSDAAYKIERFVSGEGAYADVIGKLRDEGVYSWMTQSEAETIGGWLASIDKRLFSEEVADLHGEIAVKGYAAELVKLERIFGSAGSHEADLCCWRAIAGDGAVNTNPEP